MGATKAVGRTRTETITQHRTTLPADPCLVAEVRSEFGAFLTALGVPKAICGGWLLVFNEAVMNAVIHGAASNPERSVIITWASEPNAVMLSVLDPGTGPEAAVIRAAELPEDSAESGRGMFILRTFADDLRTMQGPHGFSLTIRKAHKTRHTLPPAEAELEQVLDELSTCYENLAAFHRLGQSLLHVDRVESFLEAALDDFTLLHPFDVVRIVGAHDLSPILHEHLAALPSFRTVSAVPAPLQSILSSHCERIWDTPEERDDGPPSGSEGYPRLHRGAAIPMVAGETTFGTLVVGRGKDGEPIRSHTLSSLRTLADLFGIACANAHMRFERASAQKSVRELEIAVEIQRQLLPLLPPPTSETWKVHLHQESARGVAGDYALATTNSRGDLLVAIVDVMGKGVTAALLASIFRTAFELVRDVQPVERLMGTLNRVLCSQVGDMTMFATCAVARIDKDGRWLEHANAGHCHTVLLAPGGSTRELEPSGPPLGLVPTMTYTSDRVLLRGGERIHFLSDGCYEFTTDGKQFGWPRLIDLLERHRPRSAEDVWTSLRDIVEQSAGSEPLEDDCTLLTIDVALPPSETA